MPAPERDPYAPPPMHHDRSGALVRMAIIAALLGGAAWGYMSFADQERTALVPVEEQQMADASGYAVTEPAPPLSTTTTPEAPTPLPPVGVPPAD